MLSSWLPSATMEDSPGGSLKDSPDQAIDTSTRPGTAAKPTSMATGEAFPTKLEEWGRLRSQLANHKSKSASLGSTFSTNWLSLSVPSMQKSNAMASMSSPIPPG